MHIIRRSGAGSAWLPSRGSTTREGPASGPAARRTPIGIWLGGYGPPKVRLVRPAGGRLGADPPPGPRWTRCPQAARDRRGGTRGGARAVRDPPRPQCKRDHRDGAAGRLSRARWTTGSRRSAGSRPTSASTRSSSGRPRARWSPERHAGGRARAKGLAGVGGPASSAAGATGARRWGGGAAGTRSRSRRTTRPSGAGTSPGSTRLRVPTTSTPASSKLTQANGDPPCPRVARAQHREGDDAHGRRGHREQDGERRLVEARGELEEGRGAPPRRRRMVREHERCTVYGPTVRDVGVVGSRWAGQSKSRRGLVDELEHVPGSGAAPAAMVPRVDRRRHVRLPGMQIGKPGDRQPPQPGLSRPREGAAATSRRSFMGEVTFTEYFHLLTGRRRPRSSASSSTCCWWPSPSTG